jgi:branched-subunit amino acid aminotransferase/4-amino-4-deoxychorismate lyase
MDVYLNGRMVPHEQAAIAHDDAGFQHAVGLFETMSAHGGNVFRLEAHVARLVRSAAELGLSRALDAAALGQAVRQTLDHGRRPDARVRLTVTPGRLSLLRDRPEGPIPPTVLVVAAEPTRYDRAVFEQGVTVLVAPAAANPFDPLAGHKTLAYWWRLRLLRQAAAAQAAEAVVLNMSNHLAGGTISNLFLVKDDALHTPIAHGEEVDGALAAPVLPGITRAAIAELAAAESVAVHRRMLAIDDLLAADEVFLTNSSWQVLPVTAVEKARVGDGRVGPLTRRLRAALLELIRVETGADAPPGG